jgi:hypothetical protein
MSAVNSSPNPVRRGGKKPPRQRRVSFQFLDFGFEGQAVRAVRVLSVSCNSAKGAFLAALASMRINNLPVINTGLWFKSTPRNQRNHTVTATVQNCPIRGTGPQFPLTIESRVDADQSGSDSGL